jgi:hypothetical protein
MKTLFQSILITLALFAVAIVAGVGLGCLEQSINADTWNEGICRCGGEYEFSNAGHRKNGGNYYYYTCNECGQVIETTTPQTKTHKTYEVAGIVEDGNTLVDWNGEAWSYDGNLEPGQLVIIVFDDMGTENIYDDEILEIRG